MLTITPTAAETIKDILQSQEVPESAGIRIASTAGEEQASSGLQLSIADLPGDTDQVVDEGGARVFLAPETTSYLDDKFLSVQTDDSGEVNFAIGTQTDAS